MELRSHEDIEVLLLDGHAQLLRIAQAVQYAGDIVHHFLPTADGAAAPAELGLGLSESLQIPHRESSEKAGVACSRLGVSADRLAVARGSLGSAGDSVAVSVRSGMTMQEVTQESMSGSAKAKACLSSNNLRLLGATRPLPPAPEQQDQQTQKRGNSPY